MLWSANAVYERQDFETEAQLEEAILEVAQPLFGPDRVYVDVKRRIGKAGGVRNIPDGYLLDLTSRREPKLYLVENELSSHEPLRHIAVQILEFSLSFESTPLRVKDILKSALQENSGDWERCERYAKQSGHENVDYLLERMIYPDDAFNALVIIDEVSEELERALVRRFGFPVEIITLERFVDAQGSRVYRFDPFLHDLEPEDGKPGLTRIDPAEIDTIVVPARDEGFEEVFLGEERWYKIRIHSSMIPKIKYIAGYRVAPTSAITHYAEVRSIERWEDSNKYVVNFVGPATEIGPIAMVSGGRVRPPQGQRYSSLARLQSAKSLDEAF